MNLSEATQVDIIIEKLRKNYFSLLELWISRNSKTHQMWEFMTAALKVLNRRVKSNPKLLASLEKQLQRFFPLTEDTISLDDDDDDVKVSSKRNYNETNSSPPLPSDPDPVTITTAKKLLQTPTNNEFDCNGNQQLAVAAHSNNWNNPFMHVPVADNIFGWNYTLLANPQMLNVPPELTMLTQTQAQLTNLLAAAATPNFMTMTHALVANPGFNWNDQASCATTSRFISPIPVRDETSSLMPNKRVRKTRFEPLQVSQQPLESAQNKTIEFTNWDDPPKSIPKLSSPSPIIITPMIPDKNTRFDWNGVPSQTLCLSNASHAATASKPIQRTPAGYDQSPAKLPSTATTKLNPTYPSKSKLPEKQPTAARVENLEFSENLKKPKPNVPPDLPILSKTRMRPCAAYARPSDKESRKILTVPYKDQSRAARAKSPFDPKKQSIKLDNIKEKIYAKNFLEFDGKQKLVKEDEERQKREAEEKRKEAEEKRKEKLKKNAKVQRAKKTDVHQPNSSTVRMPTAKVISRSSSKSLSKRRANVIEDEDSEDEEENFGNIPVKRTLRPVYRGRKPAKEPVIKKPEQEKKEIFYDDDSEQLLVPSKKNYN